MEHYESKLAFPVSSLGVESNEHCDALKCIIMNGLGLVNPEKVFNFYDELHSYLASAGIDGVKVDVQNILETLGAGHGGRVKLTRKYHQELEASISRNFQDNGIISCMSHNTDSLYRSLAISHLDTTGYYIGCESCMPIHASTNSITFSSGGEAYF